MFYNKEDLELIISDPNFLYKEMVESNGLIIEDLKSQNLLSVNSFVNLLHNKIKDNKSDIVNLIAEQINYFNLWGDFEIEDLSDENKIFLSLLTSYDRNYVISEISQNLSVFNEKILDLNKLIMDCVVNEKLMEKEIFKDIAETFRDADGYNEFLNNISHYSYKLDEIVENKLLFLENINSYSVELNKFIDVNQEKMDEWSDWLVEYEKILLNDNIFNKNQLEIQEIDLMEISFFVKNDIDDTNKSFLMKNKRQLDLFVILINKFVYMSKNIDDLDSEEVNKFKNLQKQIIDIAINVDKHNLNKEVFKNGLSPNLLTYQLSLAGIVSNKSMDFLNNLEVSSPLFSYNHTSKIVSELEIGEIYSWGQIDTFDKSDISLGRMNHWNFINQITSYHKMLSKFEGLASSSKLRSIKFNMQKIINSSCFKPKEVGLNGELYMNQKVDLQKILDVISIPQYSLNEWLLAHQKIWQNKIALVKVLNKYPDSLMMKIKENKVIKGNDLNVFARDVAFNIAPLHVFKSFQDSTMPYEIALFNEGLNKTTNLYNEYKNNLSESSQNAISLIQEKVLIKSINHLLNKFYTFADELMYVNKQNYIDLMSEVNTDKIISLYDIVQELNIKEARDFWENKEIYENNELSQNDMKNKVNFYNIDVNKINKGLAPITDKRVKELSIDEMLEMPAYLCQQIEIDFAKENFDKYGLDRYAKYIDKVLSSNIHMVIKKDKLLNMLSLIDIKYNINDVSIVDAQIDHMRVNDLIIYAQKLFDYAYKKEKKTNTKLMSESLNKLSILNSECEKFVNALLEKSKEVNENIHPEEEIRNLFMKSYEEISVEQGLINKLELNDKDIFSFVKVKTLDDLVNTEFFTSFYLGKGQEVLDHNLIERKFTHAKEYAKVLSDIYENERFVIDGIYNFLSNKLDDNIYEANDHYLKNTMYGFLALVQHNQEYSLATKQDMYFGEQLNNYQKITAIGPQLKNTLDQINKDRVKLVNKINKKVLFEDILLLSFYETSLFENITDNGELLKPITLKVEPIINFMDEILEKTGSVDILECFLRNCASVSFKKDNVKKIVSKTLDILPKDKNAVFLMLALFSKKNKSTNEDKESGSELLNYLVENFNDHKNIEFFFQNMKSINFSFSNEKLSENTIIKLSTYVDNNNSINYSRIITYNKEVIEKLFEKKSSDNAQGFLLLKRADKKFNSHILKVISDNSVFGDEIKNLYEQLKKEGVSNYFRNKTMSILMDNVINNEIAPHLLNNSKEKVVIGERNEYECLMLNEILEKAPKSQKMFNDLLDGLDKYFANTVSSGAGLFLITSEKRKSIVEKYGNIVDENIKSNANNIASQNSKVLKNMFESHVKEEDQKDFFITNIERQNYSKESYVILQRILENQAKEVLSRFKVGRVGKYDSIYNFLINKDFTIYEQIIREKTLLRKIENSNIEIKETKKKKKI